MKLMFFISFWYSFTLLLNLSYTHKDDDDEYICHFRMHLTSLPWYMPPFWLVIAVFVAQWLLYIAFSRRICHWNQASYSILSHWVRLSWRTRMVMLSFTFWKDVIQTKSYKLVDHNSTHVHSSCYRYSWLQILFKELSSSNILEVFRDIEPGKNACGLVLIEAFGVADKTWFKVGPVNVHLLHHFDSCLHLMIWNVAIVSL